MSLLYRRKRLGFPPGAVIRSSNFIAGNVKQLVRLFAGSERGGTALFFAVMVVPLITFIGLAVDTTRGYLVKARMNQALDAAVLAGGRVFASPTRDDDIRMYFKANFPDGYMNAVTTPLVITPDDVEKTLTVTATATVPTTFMRLVDIDSVDVATTSQVTIASQNIEVALVLDVTASMAGQSIIDLRAAANELVDIVVQDQQVPFYSKVAIVPYSMAVNVGAAKAADVRGAIVGPKAITGATKTNPVVITSANHGFNNGDKIFIDGVNGMTQIRNNNTALTTATTSPQFWVVANATANTFALRRADNSTANGTSWGTYTNGGLIYCTSPGCEYHSFQNQQNGSWRTYRITTCVTERAGANAYTDAAPNVTPLGRNYAAPSNPCLGSTITPLSSDKADLHTKIGQLNAGGSTGGHIGVGWGWYMVSPNFGYLWPAASQPAAYGTPKLLKVVVIMTDGEYNSVYYNGVIAQDSTSGSDSTATHINQNSHNGSTYTQAQALCAAMKAPGTDITVYTVGLNVLNTPNAQALVNGCASSPSHVYLPANGAEMKDAFRDIAMKISRLRLSK